MGGLLNDDVEATSTTHQLAAQPRKVRLSFRKRSTDAEKAGQHDRRFATTEQAPTLTSNGLLMAYVRRVPSDDTAKLRSPAALPKSTTADGTARRWAVARAVDGKVSR